MVTIGATVLHYSVDKERLQLLDLLGADFPFKKRHLAAKCFFILLTAFVLSSITILFVWRFVGAWIYSSFGIVSDRSFPPVRPFPPETFSLMMLLYGLSAAMMTMYFTQVMRTVHKGKSNKAEKRGAAKVKKNAGKIVNWWRIEFQKRIDVFAENGRTSILVSANTVNHYANRFDSSVDEMYRNDHFVGYDYTYDNKKCLPVNVVAYPDHILEELSKKPSSGTLDTHKISTGEEVILMTHPFEEAADHHGVVTHRIFDKPTAKSIDDTHFTDGMQISILDVKPRNHTRLNQVIIER